MSLLEADETQNTAFVIGADEVGRGSLAGPIVAASCTICIDKIKNYNAQFLKQITDSKLLTFKKRQELFPLILSCIEGYSLSWRQNTFIDHKGLQKANIEVLYNVLARQNKIFPENTLLYDGKELKALNEINAKACIKGDQKYLSIACASIIAKVKRDEFMQKLHGLCPEYHFDSNMGYGSKKHREALKEFGASRYHRQSFLKNLL